MATDATSRPQHIEEILSGLDRYNPETVSVFQDYVQQQCDTRTYDNMANLALLKLYQFNPHLTHDETITNILVKALTVFPSPDFSLCLHLLPPNTLVTPPIDTFAEAVQKLHLLSKQLEGAEYREFWATLNSDEDGLYADLVADCSGFEELMRLRIAMAVLQAFREIKRDILEGYLNMQGEAFEGFIKNVCVWTLEGDRVKIPLNKENEAITTVTREVVKIEQFGRIFRRAYEQPC